MRSKIAALRGSAGRGFLGTAGAAAVELALMTPFLFTLLFGGYDFGNLFHAYQNIAAATRVGAEYARDSTICQAGIQVLNSPQITTGPGSCTDGIEKAMQNSGNFSPALTFPTGPTLACYCDGDNSACVPANGGNYSCTTNGKGNNELFIKVSASQATNSLITWPGFPPTLQALTELRIQ